MQKLFYAVAAFIIIHSSFNISNASAQAVQIYRSGIAVGTPHSTLASAIAAAINGDSLKLSAHTFYEHDVLINKNLVIAGTYSSPDSTTIDAQSLGRVLMTKSKFITLRDLIITHGKVSGGTSAGFINSGGGIRMDTTGVLVLCGRTIVRDNSATGYGGGICSPNATSFIDSIILKLKDHTEVSNNIAGSKAGVALQANFRSKIYLSDDIVISGNQAITLINAVTGGIQATTIVVEGTGAEGGVRVMNNSSLGTCGGLAADTLYLNGTITVSHNSADSVAGGIWGIRYLYGSGKLSVSNNKAYYGGGAGDMLFRGGENASIDIFNNRAKFGGGIAIVDYSSVFFSNMNMNIYNNIADSAGGAAYFSNLRSTSNLKVYLNKVNFYNNKAPKYNGIFISSRLGFGAVDCALRNSRLFNPLSSGAHNNEEVYSANNTSFNADSCWFGESDTTGLIRKDASSSITLTRTVKCDWQINNGVPVTHFPFPLTARFKLSTGVPLPSGSFPMLEGRFSGTMGAFTPAISPINTSNDVESIFKASGSGSASIMGIVDADTFKANLTVSSIKEIGFEQVKIFPNPVTDVIYLQGVESGSTFELYDITGKLLKKEQLMNTNAQVDIMSFPSGIFNLKITNNSGQTGNAKIVKD